MADVLVEEYVLLRFSKLYKDQANLAAVVYNRIATSDVAYNLQFAAEQIVNNADVTIKYILVPKSDRINVNNI